jgi:DNA-binding NarL/FixJ family response regulator
MTSIAITHRQREVLTLLARGWTAAEIGTELAISTRTVRAHLDALRLKLGARRCRELPALYRRLSGVDLLAERESTARTKRPRS